MNSFLGPLWAFFLALVFAVPAFAGQGIVTIYGVTSNGGSPPTYTCNVSSSAGITVGDHVMAKTTSAGATGVWLVTSKPSATSVVLQDSLTEETGTAFGAPLANITNGLAYGTPESGATMIPDGASWWAAAARRNYVVLAEASPDGSALTKTDDTNVTLTLGGTPGTALLQATSLTLGWTGTLAESRGGTGASSLSAGIDAAFGSTRGSILYRGASGWVILAPGTSGHALVSNGAGADPSYASVLTATPSLDSILEAGATASIAGGISITSGDSFFLQTTNSQTFFSGTYVTVLGDTQGALLQANTSAPASIRAGSPGRARRDARQPVALTDASATNVMSFQIYNTGDPEDIGGGQLVVAVTAYDGTARQVLIQRVTWAAYYSGGTHTVDVDVENLSHVESTGTLAATWAGVNDGTTLRLRCTADSSLASPTIYANLTADVMGITD